MSITLQDYHGFLLPVRALMLITLQDYHGFLLPVRALMSIALQDYHGFSIARQGINVNSIAGLSWFFYCPSGH